MKRLAPDDVEKQIAKVEYLFPGSCKRMVICVVSTHNGFAVSGQAVAATDENFDESVGKEEARKKAVERLWEPMIYALREDQVG